MSILEHFVSLRSNKKSEILITDKKVGDILVERKLIKANQLKHALHYQKTHSEYNGKIGEICVQLGWIKKIDLIKVVSEHYHIPLALAILEKREIARKMQREALANSDQKENNANIVDNDFIDSLDSTIDEPIDQPKEEAQVDEVFSQTLDYRTNDSSAYKLQYEKPTLNKDPYEVPLINAPIPKSNSGKSTSQRSIIELVLTKRLQNGLIETNNYKERKSVDYILNLIKTSQIESALEYIEKVKDKHNTSALFCQIEVFALIHDFRFEQAQKCLNDFNPDFNAYPELLDLKSVLFQLLDKHEEAVKNYTNIIQTKKLSSFCYFSLAYSLDQLNLSKQATKIYKHFVNFANSSQSKQLAYAQSKI